MNPLTEAVYSITKLATLNSGYVGLKGGLSGLLQIDPAKLQTQQFQYTTVDMSLKNQWLDIATFNKLVDWRINGNPNEIQWNATLRAPILYMICKDYGAKVFIGIRGGQKALEQMDPSVIAASQWGIRMSKASSNWIDGQIFYDILSKKYKEDKIINKVILEKRYDPNMVPDGHHFNVVGVWLFTNNDVQFKTIYGDLSEWAEGISLR